MTTRVACLAALLVFAVGSPARAKPVRVDFASRPYSIDLPDHYEVNFQRDDSYHFRDRRLDFGQGVFISVTFYDMNRWPKKERMSLRPFAEYGLWPGRHRGPHTIHEQGEVRLDRVPAIRTFWSNWWGREKNGYAQTQPPRQWGVSIAVVKDGIGVLIAADGLEPYAPEGVKEVAASLATFKFSARK